jgi:hypothetical protein
MLHPGRPLKGRALIDALEAGAYAAYARQLAAECAAEDSTLLYDDGEGVYGLRNRLFQRLDQAKEAYGGVFTAISSLMKDDDAIALTFLAARPAAASTHNTRVTEAPLNVLLALFDALDAVGGPKAFAAYAHQLAAEYAAEIGTHHDASDRKSRLVDELDAMQNTMAGVFMAVRNLMNDDDAIADAIALATGKPVGDLNFDRISIFC